MTRALMIYLLNEYVRTEHSCSHHSEASYDLEAAQEKLSSIILEAMKTCGISRSPGSFYVAVGSSIFRPHEMSQKVRDTSASNGRRRRKHICWHRPM